MTADNTDTQTNSVNETLLILNAALLNSPPEEQQKVKDAQEKLRCFITEFGDAGIFAIALHGAQYLLEAA